MNKEVKKPLIEFLKFFLHLHKLSGMLVHSLANYEKLSQAMANAERVLAKVAPEKTIKSSIDRVEWQKENLETVRKEISENFYTLKSSEVILIYSRLESAISETIYLIFKHADLTKLKEMESVKINAV